MKLDVVSALRYHNVVFAFDRIKKWFAKGNTAHCVGLLLVTGKSQVPCYFAKQHGGPCFSDSLMTAIRWLQFR